MPRSVPEGEYPLYVTGSANRLLSNPTYTYEYDEEGNRTSRTDRVSGDRGEYTWDHRTG